VPPVPNIQPCGHKPDQERIAYPDALQEALERYQDDSATSDLLLLMAWRTNPRAILVPSCGLPRYAVPTPFWRQDYEPAETDAGTRRDRAPTGRLDDSEAEVLRGRPTRSSACCTSYLALCLLALVSVYGCGLLEYEPQCSRSPIQPVSSLWVRRRLKIHAESQIVSSDDSALR
jgi:hypothetical protein